MNKWSMFLSLVVATTPVVFADLASAAVPPVDRAGKPALTVCPTAGPPNTIFHFDKVIFQIGAGNLVPIIAADAAQLNALPRTTGLDIKILDNPRTVADLKGKVLSFLGAQPSLAANRQLIRIDEVEYAVVRCPAP
ncbi:MAG: hypothetical protein L0Y50_11220 [Beijerinckiaceae bacterium]|nr:hypothetical protein [Beijerinckiaceae bacterium]